MFFFQGRRWQKHFFWGGRQGLVVPRAIVLNLVTHVANKESPEGLVPNQHYWGGGAGPPIEVIGGALHPPAPQFCRPLIIAWALYGLFK